MTTKELYENPALRTIRLYGVLGAKFGRVHRLAVTSTAEAVRALCILYDGFEAFLMNARDRNLGFAVFLDKTNIGQESLHLQTQREIRIAPIVIGAKGGIFQIILGIALIAVSFFIPGGGLIAAGLFNAGMALALGGIVQLLSPHPKDQKSKDKQEPNYAFNGPVNTQAQGNCVPVAYGQPWTGSAVVSAGITVGTDVIISQPSGEGVDRIAGLVGLAYYYVNGLADGGGDYVPDISGNSNPNAYLSGSYSLTPSDGVLYTNVNGEAHTTLTGLSMTGTKLSGYAAFIVTDEEGGSVIKNISSMFTNSVFGWMHFGLYLDGPNKLTPTLQLGNGGGTGSFFQSDEEITLNTPHTIGFEWDTDADEGRLIVNGIVKDSGPAPGGNPAIPGSGSFAMGGSFYPDSYGLKGKIGPCFGLTRLAEDDEERAYFHEILLNRFQYVPTSDGDDWAQIIHEAWSD